MTDLQGLELRASEIRSRLAELGLLAELDTEQRGEMETLGKEYGNNEARQRALRIAGDGQAAPIETRNDGEGREYRELRRKAGFGAYVAGALSGGGVKDGAELELNRHLGIADNHFPMEMLAGLDDFEKRAARDGDGMASQSTWLDRVMAEASAMHLGVSMRTVAPGTATFPYTSAGGAPIQRGRTEGVTESTYTIKVEEMKPTRAAVNAKYSIEDNLRLPGMADSIERDMRAAMAQTVDLLIFVGDDGSNEDTADITGFTTYTDVDETTLTQAHKVDAFRTVAAFTDLIDGVYAGTPADLNIVAAVGANKLWLAQQANSNRNETVAQVMMGNGLNWVARGGIEANSAAGDFGAFVGLAKGIEGAAVAAVWDAGQLITDPYSNSKTGEVELTLNYLWNFKVIRADSFKRLKFVA